MKRLLKIVVIGFLLSNPTSVFAQSVDIIGEWKEFWGVGSESSIGYNDVFTIVKKGKKLIIYCAERDNYMIKKIRFNNSKLTFRLLNTSGNDILPYSLSLSEDGNWLKGTAINIYGKIIHVDWKRINQ